MQVLDFLITPGSNAGDHFASIMFRCKLTYTSKSQKNGQLSMIIKTVPHEEGLKKDLLGKSPIFETEMAMYGKTLPNMERLLRAAGDNAKFGPKYEHSC